MDQKQPTEPTSDSLENTSSTEGASLEGGEATDDDSTKKISSEKIPKKGLGNKVRGLLARVNIYLLLFILMVIIALAIVFVAIQASKQEANKSNTTTQSLSEDALKNLEGSDAKVGDPKQTLSVESNAIFAGKVLIQNGLEVAGGLKLGGILSLAGINVSGASTFDQILTNGLTVNGNATITGLVSIQKGIAVSGPATFSSSVSAPQITIDRLQINQDLQFSRHVDAGGPSASVSSGSGVGSGGNVTISGTDTAGTVTINVGTGAPAGVFANVSFANKFNGIPHVIITPIGSAAGGLNWYVTSRTTTGFSIASGNAAAPGSFSFDYIVVD